VRITKRTVDAAETNPARDEFLWDDQLLGFGLRVGQGGSKSYVVQYRTAGGRSRRLTIGKHGPLTPEEARGIAKQHLAAAARGEDPAERKAALRAEPTFAEFAKLYLADHAETKKKPKSRAEDQKILDAVLLPEFRTRKITSISRQDVARLHSSLSKTPVWGNRVVALLSKMMNLAEAWGYRPEGSNPCRHIEKYPEKPRKRFLSGAELARLSVALQKLETTPPPPPGKKGEEDRITASQALLFRLLLFTGCRLNEILSLRWDEIDFERGLLLLPDSKTGQKTVVLSAPALKLLSEAETAEGNPYVIPGGHKNRKGEPAHVSNPAKAWEKVRTAAKIQDVHIHDLRHTFASIGAGSGLGLPMIGALLGQSQPATTQRYAHLAVDPQKRAADLIAGEISAAMEGKPPAKVVDMTGGRKDA
jgi:integrase